MANRKSKATTEDEPVRDRMIQIRMSAEERECVKRAARRESLPLATYIRQVAVKSSDCFRPAAE